MTDEAKAQGSEHWCSYILLKLIRGYQLLLSPWLGRQCRFEPSCSHYAQDAIIEHGPFKGSGMAILRIARCHPWHEGGYDPVPLKEQRSCCSQRQPSTD